MGNEWDLYERWSLTRPSIRRWMRSVQYCIMTIIMAAVMIFPFFFLR